MKIVHVEFFAEESFNKYCIGCKQYLPTSRFYYHPNHSDKLFAVCKSCHHTSARRNAKIRREDHKHRLLESSKIRSRHTGQINTLKLSDIGSPEFCKYLGVKIDYTPPSKRGSSRKWDSPSIDRIDNTKGYTPDNVQIISELANRMKQEASIEQLVAFARNVIEVHGHNYPPPLGVAGSAACCCDQRVDITGVLQ